MVETVNRIKQRARDKGVKLKKICENLGYKESYLGGVKDGKAKMTDSQLSVIADMLDTTPEYLRGETDDPERTPMPGKGDEPLNEAEIAVLEWYRSAPPELREAVRRMAGLKDEG